MVAAYAGALADARPGRVVALSSIGAQIDRFNLLNNAGLLEQDLVNPGVPIAFLRPAWFIENAVAPLWREGYRGFFLDTLDSYRLAANFDEKAQQDGLVRVIETLHKRYPGIRLILNRGFEIVPRVRDKVQMVAAESLLRTLADHGVAGELSQTRVNAMHVTQ